jgi:hypothetical protein
MLTLAPTVQLLAMPHCALYASSSRQSYRGTRAASHVGVGLGNTRAPCQTKLGQAMPYSVGSLRGVHYQPLGAGELARTVPSRALCIVRGEARRAWAGSRPAGRSRLLWATSFRPVQHYGWAVAGRAHTVRVGHARISAQWPV